MLKSVHIKTPAPPLINHELNGVGDLVTSDEDPYSDNACETES